MAAELSQDQLDQLLFELDTSNDEKEESIEKEEDTDGALSQEQLDKLLSSEDDPPGENKKEESIEKEEDTDGALSQEQLDKLLSSENEPPGENKKEESIEKEEDTDGALSQEQLDKLLSSEDEPPDEDKKEESIEKEEPKVEPVDKNAHSEQTKMDQIIADVKKDEPEVEPVDKNTHSEQKKMDQIVTGIEKEEPEAVPTDIRTDSEQKKMEEIVAELKKFDLKSTDTESDSIDESLTDDYTDGLIDEPEFIEETIKITEAELTKADVIKAETEEGENKKFYIREKRLSLKWILPAVFLGAFCVGWFVKDLFTIKQIILDNRKVAATKSLPQPQDSPPLLPERRIVEKDEIVVEKYLEKIDSLMKHLGAKQSEIDGLINYYKNGNKNIEEEILREKEEKHITTYGEAIKNKRIELNLYTIQRRNAYMENLNKPYWQLQYALEELLFTKREAKIDINMIPFSREVNRKKIINQIDSVINRYDDMDRTFSIDKNNLKLQEISLIWKEIKQKRINRPYKKVFTPKSNRIIWENFCKGNFDGMNDLTQLSPGAAFCLSKWESKELYLSGLTSLSPEEAKNLISWKGEWICLNGLTEISPETAKFLSNWHGKRLSLNGISELSSASAEHLSKWQGEQLELIGLDKISAQTAKYLSQWIKSGGNIYLKSKFLRKNN